MARVSFLIIFCLATSGCLQAFGSGDTQLDLPTEDECQPRTPHWKPNCPLLFLQSYYLHAQDPRFVIEADGRLHLRLTLHAWDDVDVTVTEINGIVGHHGSNQTGTRIEWQPNTTIPAGSSAEFAAESEHPAATDAWDAFYALRIWYEDSRNPGFAHLLLVFNRCFGIESGELVPVETVPGFQGAIHQCDSDDYLATGEVSEVALIVHDFANDRHAYPAADDIRFWSSVRPGLE